MGRHLGRGPHGYKKRVCSQRSIAREVLVCPTSLQDTSARGEHHHDCRAHREPHPPLRRITCSVFENQRYQTSSKSWTDNMTPETDTNDVVPHRSPARGSPKRSPMMQAKPAAANRAAYSHRCALRIGRLQLTRSAPAGTAQASTSPTGMVIQW